MSRASIKHLQAVIFLKNYILRNAPPSGVLPPVRTLAALAKVSTFTMAMAQKELAKNGQLQIRRGVGTWIAGHAPPQLPERFASFRNLRLARVADLRDILEQDIMVGKFKASETLPRSKELCAQYGAHQQTIGKALKLLVKDKVVVNYKRTYKVRSAIQTSSTATIIFIISIYGSGIAGFANRKRDYEFLRTLEKECLNARTELAIVPYTDAHRRSESIDLFAQTFRHCIQGRILLGIIVSLHGIDKLPAMFSMLEKLRLPVSLFDETNGGHRPFFDESLIHGPLMRAFKIHCPAGACGKAVGRYLLELGHRCIAYVTIYPSYDWSVQRYHALQHVVMAAKGKVRHFEMTVDHSSIFRKVFSDAESFIDSSIARKTKDIESEGFFPASNDDMENLVFNQIHKANALPLLRSALFNKKITAWVADDDVTAMAMLDFLSRKGIRVPEDISVVGFDNLYEAQIAGLTSYDFNLNGAANACLSFILNPRSSQKRHGEKVMEIEGMVIPRMSTGRARQS